MGAEDVKAEGNKKFAEGAWEEALDLYTEALSIDPENEVLYRCVFSSCTVGPGWGLGPVELTG
jgi:tetratricopeptide (TPR) repeat protein